MGTTTGRKRILYHNKRHAERENPRSIQHIMAGRNQGRCARSHAQNVKRDDQSSF